VAGFAGGALVFKAPRHIQHVLSAEDFGPNFIEMGGATGATGAGVAPGATGVSASMEPYLVIRINMAITETESKTADAQAKAVTAIFADTEQTKAILSNDGFPGSTIGLAKPVNVDRAVETTKKKPAPKKLKLKKASATKTSLPFVSVCIAAVTGVWMASR